MHLKILRIYVLWWSVFRGVMSEETHPAFWPLVNAVDGSEIAWSSIVKTVLLLEYPASSLRPVSFYCCVPFPFLSFSRQRWRLEAVVIHIGFMCQWPVYEGTTGSAICLCPWLVIFCALVACQRYVTCASSRNWKEPVWLGFLGNTWSGKGPLAALAGLTSLIGNLICRPASSVFSTTWGTLSPGW